MFFNFGSTPVNPHQVRMPRQAGIAIPIGGEAPAERFNEWGADQDPDDEGECAEDFDEGYMQEGYCAQALLDAFLDGEDLDRGEIEFDLALAELPSLFSFGFGLVSAGDDGVVQEGDMLSELGSRVAIVLALADGGDVEGSIELLLEALPDWLQAHPTLTGALRVVEGVDMEIGSLVEELRCLGMQFDQSAAIDVDGADAFVDLE